jgi:GTP cyclohydrolase II
MLKSLGVKSVKLLTNNPNKVEQLTNNGINVVERVPHRFKPNVHNEFYLKTKKEISKHLL